MATISNPSNLFQRQFLISHTYSNYFNIRLHEATHSTRSARLELSWSKSVFDLLNILSSGCRFRRSTHFSKQIRSDQKVDTFFHRTTRMARNLHDCIWGCKFTETPLIQEIISSVELPTVPNVIQHKFFPDVTTSCCLIVCFGFSLSVALLHFCF